METIRAVTSTPDKTAYAYSLVAAALRTHQAVASTGEARLTCIRRLKAKKILTSEERVAERLVYTRCFDTVASDRGGNVVDGLMSAMEDKRLEFSITTVAKAQATAQVKADKPQPDRPDKPNDKPDKPDKNKAKPKHRTGAPPSPLLTRHTRRPRPTRKNDGVTRRAASCTPDSNYMRHRVRRNWQSMKRYRRERSSLEVGLLIYLRRTANGHICTLDSGRDLTLHT
jgi:hypothetical protein